MRWLPYAVGGFVALAVPCSAADKAPRIGILSDAGARKEADLLMVELQKAFWGQGATFNIVEFLAEPPGGHRGQGATLDICFAGRAGM
jgi:hypothetical protein